jgi:energy-coupling factor transport system permease protein
VSLLAPLALSEGWLARRDATAKLLAATVCTGALLVSLNPVTALVGIALQLAIAPLAGLRYRALLRRSWPLLTGALGVFAFTVLFSTHRSGPVLLSAFGFAVHRAAAVGALSYALRLIAVALPGLLAFATIDPTDLADSLMAHLRVPPRFAIGTLAAFRLMPLLADEWRLLTLARRARGVDAGWNPVSRLRLVASTTFALLVGAIRRGTRLATAMEARGFDSGVPRTIARPTQFGPLDLVVIAAAALLATVALFAGSLL